MAWGFWLAAIEAVARATWFWIDWTKTVLVAVAITLETDAILASIDADRSAMYWDTMLSVFVGAMGAAMEPLVRQMAAKMKEERLKTFMLKLIEKERS